WFVLQEDAYPTGSSSPRVDVMLPIDCPKPNGGRVVKISEDFVKALSQVLKENARVRSRLKIPNRDLERYKGQLNMRLGRLLVILDTLGWYDDAASKLPRETWEEAKGYFTSPVVHTAPPQDLPDQEDSSPGSERTETAP